MWRRRRTIIGEEEGLAYDSNGEKNNVASRKLTWRTTTTWKSSPKHLLPPVPLPPLFLHNIHSEDTGGRGTGGGGYKLHGGNDADGEQR